MSALVLSIAALCWLVFQLSDVFRLLWKYSTRRADTDIGVYQTRSINFGRTTGNEFVEDTPLCVSLATRRYRSATESVRATGEALTTEESEDMPDAIQQDVGDSTPTPPHERTHAHIRTRVDTDAHTAARAQPHRQIPDSSTHTNPVVPNIRLNSTQPRLPNTRTYGTLHQALCGYCRQPDHALPACTKYRLYCGHLPEHTDEALGQKQCVYCDQFGHPWTACPQFYSDSIVCESCGDRGHYKSRCPDLCIHAGEPR